MLEAMNVKTGMTLCSINSGVTLARLDTSSKAACCTCGFVVVRTQSMRVFARMAERSRSWLEDACETLAYSAAVIDVSRHMKPHRQLVHYSKRTTESKNQRIA